MWMNFEGFEGFKEIAARDEGPRRVAKLTPDGKTWRLQWSPYKGLIDKGPDGIIPALKETYPKQYQYLKWGAPDGTPVWIIKTDDSKGLFALVKRYFTIQGEAATPLTRSSDPPVYRFRGEPLGFVEEAKERAAKARRTALARRTQLAYDHVKTAKERRLPSPASPRVAPSNAAIVFNGPEVKKYLATMEKNYQDVARVAGVTEGCARNWLNRRSVPGIGSIIALNKAGLLPPPGWVCPISVKFVNLPTPPKAPTPKPKPKVTSEDMKVIRDKVTYLLRISGTPLRVGEIRYYLTKHYGIDIEAHPRRLRHVMSTLVKDQTVVMIGVKRHAKYVWAKHFLTMTYKCKYCGHGRRNDRPCPSCHLGGPE